MPLADNYDVAIVGAGFSGTMVAVQLARQSQGKLRILLLERGPAPGRGVAYGTTDIHHLLNVRAANMGAFPDQPNDFYEWLTNHPEITGAEEIKPDRFMPRLIFGAYVQDVLRRTREEFGSIDIAHADVRDIVRGEDGYRLWNQQEEIAKARFIVLALGNFPPGASNTGNPYRQETIEKLMGDGDVFLIGAGLTSLDMLVSMARGKPKGDIHILSRGGQFPQMHEAIVPYPAFLDKARLPKTVLELLSRIRREVRAARKQGIGWQSVLDALRPLSQEIWQGLPITERKKFLRRLRGVWDSHRHRAAPEIMAARDKLLAEGRLIQHRGSFVSLSEGDDGIVVTWQPSGGAPQTITVEAAVNCMGPQMDFAKMEDALVQNLMRRDLLASDDLRLGADTDAQGRLRNRKGETITGLYTLGMWRKGRLYESVAVPELRVQADTLAQTIISDQP